MNKKLVLLNAVFLVGMLLVACGTVINSTPAQNQGSMYEISARLQATEAPPPIPLPTIIVNPTPGQGGGSFIPTDPVTLLLYVLVGAIIFIALIAVLRR